MGNGVSQPALSLDPLGDLVSTKDIALNNNVFWEQLLNPGIPLTKLSPSAVDVAVAPYCESLEKNNSQTRNFQKLLYHCSLRVKGAGNPGGALRAANAITSVRVVIKHLTESLNASQLLTFLDLPLDLPANGASGAGHHGDIDVVRLFTRTLLETAVSLPVSSETYLVHVELLLLLLVMCGTQLYTPTATALPGSHPFTTAIMLEPNLAPPVVQVLLQHYMERQKLPPRAPLYEPTQQAQAGVFRLVRSAAATVLWLPLRAFTFLVRSGPPVAVQSPLGDTALLLLLVLLHHAPPPELGPPNPFHSGLQHMQDLDDADTDDAAEGGRGAGGGGPAVSYAALYDAMSRGLINERAVLLLYDLLHDCQHFLNYILVRSDLEALLVPLLAILYSASGRTPSQMYMLLIIILILSQDAAFARNIHTIHLRSVPWYKDRLLTNTTLGSLLVVVLLRTAHYNLAKLKDVYLHTNTLAALANLAPHMAHLSSHASQRLVSLFDMLSRRYGRLMRESEAAGDPDLHAAELRVYTDFLRIVLEILNCILTTRLAENPELVYALLHRQEVFAPFRTLPRFGELVNNIELVLNFFNQRVDAARGAGGGDWSVDRVLDCIKGNMREWRPTHLQQFPELRFTYEEEASPQDFFVPYVWTLVVTHTSIPWNPHTITLFSPVTPESEQSTSTDLYDPTLSSQASGASDLDASDRLADRLKV